MIEMVDKSL